MMNVTPSDAIAEARRMVAAERGRVLTQVDAALEALESYLDALAAGAVQILPPETD